MILADKISRQLVRGEWVLMALEEFADFELIDPDT